MNGKECQEPSIDAQLKLATKTPCWEWSGAEAYAIGCYNHDDRKTPMYSCDSADDWPELEPLFHAACTNSSCLYICMYFNGIVDGIREYANRVFAINNITGNLIEYEAIQRHGPILILYLLKQIDKWKGYTDNYTQRNTSQLKTIEALEKKIELFQNGKINNHEKRADIWDKSYGRCWYCGKYIHPFREFEIDHVVPRSKGGTDEFSNLVPACRPCNRTKTDKTIEEFRFYLADALVANMSDQQRYMLSISFDLLRAMHPSEVHGYNLCIDNARLKFYFEHAGLQS